MFVQSACDPRDHGPSDRGACAATWMPCRPRVSTSSPNFSGSSNQAPPPAAREPFVFIVPPIAGSGNAPIFFPERSGLDKHSNADQNGRTKHAPSRFRIAGRRMEWRRMMLPNAAKGFNFDLGETAEAIRETVRDFARRRSRRGRRRSTAPIFSRAISGPRWAISPARHHGRGGIRGTGLGYLEHAIAMEEVPAPPLRSGVYGAHSNSASTRSAATAMRSRSAAIRPS